MLSIINYIDENFRDIVQITDIAQKFHTSISTLERNFQKYLSINPKQYLEDKKLAHACLLLSQGASVTDACFGSGFNDYSHFIARFKRKFGTTPKKMQQ